MTRVVIIGGGPAGLTAAHELLHHDNFKPVVVDEGTQPGGISKTILYKGNRMDIGGHRFFSKSDRVMQWWQTILPPSGFPAPDDLELGRYIPVFPNGPNPEEQDKVMLIRHRLSRILYERKFYPYPFSLGPQVVKNLGLSRTLLIGLGYLVASLNQKSPEINLEDFLINRFGRPLYHMFFKDYTKKVWGKRCKDIDASWGYQRIKGLSVKRALLQAIKSNARDLHQKHVETTLINYFLYPKYGPGQLWEEVSRRIRHKGGEISFCNRVEKILLEGKRVRAVQTRNLNSGELKHITGEFFISSMPVKDLVLGLSPAPSDAVITAASELPYRDFVTVGILIEDANMSALKDNWIYVQERDVKVGRIQIFNNWSPYMVATKDALWISLEYFCQEGDNIWALSDVEMKNLAISELLNLGFIRKKSWVRDGCVVRVPKTYPAYWAGYKKFHIIREFTDTVENLFLVGRNGMHCYNNQDHSMLTAMEAVKNIVEGRIEKENIWQINTETDYHEEGVLRRKGIMGTSNP